jgi:acyl carrier protein
MMPRTSRLTEVLADMIADASDGEVSAQQALAADCSFIALGLTSLAQVRFIDAIECEFGIDIDPDDDLFFQGTILDLTEYLARRGAELNTGMEHLTPREIRYTGMRLAQREIGSGGGGDEGFDRPQGALYLRLRQA